MIELEVYGERYSIEYVVFDMNGTLSVDGTISDEIKSLLEELAAKVKVYILTSDTFNTAKNLHIEGVEVVVLDATRSASVQKKEFVETLDPEKTVAVGNGYNDHLMLERAAVGIAVCWREGACVSALEMADVVVTSPKDAIELLLHPLRLKATTRD